MRVIASVFAITIATVCASARAAEPSIHGIGVNYFDCFYRTIANKEDRAYEQGFEDLTNHKIPFARFMCGGYWPSEWKLYRDDSTEYFRRLDQVIAAAKKNHVALIPCLFLNPPAVPDIVGESCDQWGNPSSKTYAFMLAYTREVVKRYKDDPTIMAWEFGNEFNLLADLPNAATQRPAIQPTLGTPTTRTAHDELTSEQVTIAQTTWAHEVRKLDAHRMLLTGNSTPRASAWHQQHEHSWTHDSDEQQIQMLAAQNPEPFDTICIHVYELDDIARLPLLAQAAIAQHRPLVIEEFGAEEKGEATRARFDSLLAKIEQLNIPLAALWVFNFNHQPEWSVTSTNARSYQLDAIAKINSQIISSSR